MFEVLAGKKYDQQTRTKGILCVFENYFDLLFTANNKFGFEMDKMSPDQCMGICTFFKCLFLFWRCYAVQRLTIANLRSVRYASISYFAMRVFGYKKLSTKGFLFFWQLFNSQFGTGQRLLLLWVLICNSRALVSRTSGVRVRLRCIDLSTELNPSTAQMSHCKRKCVTQSTGWGGLHCFGFPLPLYSCLWLKVKAQILTGCFLYGDTYWWQREWLWSVQALLVDDEKQWSTVIWSLCVKVWTTFGLFFSILKHNAIENVAWKRFQ